MPKSSIVHDPVLLRESLTIKKIICFASGMRDWPPLDEFWVGIQADLKDACDRGDLPHSPRPHIQHRALYSIRLLDLWKFLLKKDQRWRPLREFCRRWRQAQGGTLSPEYDEQAGGLASPSSSPSNLTDETRSKGGSKAKYKVGLQKFINQLFADFDERDTLLTPSRLKTWLVVNAPKDEGKETDIPSCDDVEFYDDKVWWKDHQGRQESIQIRAVERYILRAKKRTSGEAA